MKKNTRCAGCGRRHKSSHDSLVETPEQYTPQCKRWKRRHKRIIPNISVKVEKRVRSKKHGKYKNTP